MPPRTHKRRHSAPDLYEAAEMECMMVAERKASTLEEIEMGYINEREEKEDTSSTNTTVGYVEEGVDQETSRDIQKRIVEGSPEEVEGLYRSVRPSLRGLVVDVFGNYIVQKLVETGTPHIIADVSAHVSENFITYATNQYGCRIVQRCLTSSSATLVLPLVKEHLLLLTEDPHGNHVVQKSIETHPEMCEFVVATFSDQLVKYAAHPYGCRVIQRVLENASTATPIVPILQTVMKKIQFLVADQYGNYVVQHVLTNGHPVYKENLTARMKGHFSLLCTHKYASNVVEKMYESASPDLKNSILQELTQPLASDPSHTGLSRAAVDQYGNYVAQKLYDLSTPEKKNFIKAHLRPYVRVMHCAPYGRHFATMLSL